MSLTNKYLIDLYTSHYNQYGSNHKGLGWGNKDRTNLRFDILSSRWNLNNSSILDVGCGFGDFYDLLKLKAKQFQYTGIDINAAFINVAQKKHPDAKFIEYDLKENSELQKFDYVFASGIFNDKVPRAKQRTIDLLKAIRSHTIKGFAVNFLSNKVDYKLPHANHTDPAWAIDQCYAFSNNIILRNDYIPFEFTIFVDCYEKYDRDQVVYKNFL